MIILRLPLQHPLSKLALAGLLAGGLASCAASAEAVPAGAATLAIDASDSKTWIYVNFARRSPILPPTTEPPAEWDLAFQRHRVMTNGGDSGKGGVAVAKLVDQDFDALTVAPATGYVTDSHKPTGNTIGDLYFAFLGDDPWYTYSAEHKLGAKPRVYVVKTTGGKYVKLQMLGYYDAAGQSGHPQFKYAEIQAPNR